MKSEDVHDSRTIEVLLKVLEGGEVVSPPAFMEKAKAMGVYPAEWVRVVKQLVDVGLITPWMVDNAIHGYSIKRRFSTEVKDDNK